MCEPLGQIFALAKTDSHQAPLILCQCYSCFMCIHVLFTVSKYLKIWKLSYLPYISTFESFSFKSTLLYLKDVDNVGLSTEYLDR